MKYLKLSKELRLPALGLGTWGIGGGFESNRATKMRDIKIIKDALSLGYSHIDTAAMYGQGQTERVIGEAIGNVLREDIFLTTKVWKTNLHYESVLKSLDASLKRLKTTYVDLFLVHWPNLEIPIKETMKAMEFLYRKGKVKAIGVSNFSVEGIREAQSALEICPMVANQIEYNLIERKAEQEVIPFCRKNNVIVIAYRPLAKGLLSTKANAILDELGGKYKKTPSQIALKWVISNEGIAAISKAGSYQHLKENIGIFDWELTKKDKEKLGLWYQR